VTTPNAIAIFDAASHTQAEAAAHPEAAGLPYLGVWRAAGTDMTVHVHAAYTERQLLDAGWTRVEEMEESA
jgi:hypothetical protein